MVDISVKRAATGRREIIRRYLKRRQLYPFQIATKPSAELQIVVVVPCFDEPDLTRTLNSLANCDNPDCAVEILVVINGPEGMTATARRNNARISRQIVEWANEAGALRPRWLSIFELHHEGLPAAQAGVGLARKIGMDEAVSRIGATPLSNGIIVSLDADCAVDKNYLREIHRQFSEHPACPGMSIYFEHEVLGADTDPLDAAIGNYELHLRCYVAGQRLAGFPYAHHTVGSAMACRAAAYAGQGGMNRRQGGEDFYFIQKLIALGGYRALNSTTVRPAVRVSDRVPFGTGPAMRDSLATGAAFRTYCPQIYSELDNFCTLLRHSVPDAFAGRLDELPDTLKVFLQRQDFFDRLVEIKANVASHDKFRKRVYRWFNAFRFMKFAQFASQERHPRVPVRDAASRLAELGGFCNLADSASSQKWLELYRAVDRQSNKS